VTFAEKALQPAKVSKVTVVDSGGKHLEVVVDDSQLSLAIGKKGQNVRLAAKLLGWRSTSRARKRSGRKWSSRCRPWLPDRYAA